MNWWWWCTYAAAATAAEVAADLICKICWTLWCVINNMRWHFFPDPGKVLLPWRLQDCCCWCCSRCGHFVGSSCSFCGSESRMRVLLFLKEDLVLYMYVILHWTLTCVVKRLTCARAGLRFLSAHAPDTSARTHVRCLTAWQRSEREEKQRERGENKTVTSWWCTSPSVLKCRLF